MLFELDDLTVDYGKARALDSVSLSVSEGEIVAVIGPNGAGKTTLLRTVSGLLAPTSGKILFKDENIAKLPPKEIVRRGISHCPEGRKVFPGMTVLGNLLMGAYTRRGDIQADLESVWALFPILKERKNQRGGTLSGGEQGMLSIARGLMAKPTLLLIDEATLGLAPIVCIELAKRIKEISERGVAILLVEQNARLAFSISQRCYVLEHGLLVGQGATEEVKEVAHVKQAYLGL